MGLRGLLQGEIYLFPSYFLSCPKFDTACIKFQNCPFYLRNISILEARTLKREAEQPPLSIISVSKKPGTVVTCGRRLSPFSSPVMEVSVVQLLQKAE